MIYVAFFFSPFFSQVVGRELIQPSESPRSSGTTGGYRCFLAFLFSQKRERKSSFFFLPIIN